MKKIQGTCKYKDDRKNRPNLIITFIDFGDFVNVEEWDVNENYDSLQPLEEDKQSAIKYCQDKIKEIKLNLIGDKEKDKKFKDEIKELQDLINAYNKYKNKRFRFKKEEFKEKFSVAVYSEPTYKKKITSALTGISDSEFIDFLKSHGYKGVEVISSRCAEAKDFIYGKFEPNHRVIEYQYDVIDKQKEIIEWI